MYRRFASATVESLAGFDARNSALWRAGTANYCVARGNRGAVAGQQASREDRHPH